MINKAFNGEESLLEAAANPCYCACWCPDQTLSDDSTDDKDAEIKAAN